MTALTYPIRIFDNDFSTSATISVGSSVSGFSYTNAANSRRSLCWKPGGTFYVTATNNLIYINDGSNVTVTLTAGTYTYSTLATHIQTQLNASSSGWTVAYNSTTTFKFTISRSSSATLRFSQTTSAAWDMLGYTGTADIAATSWLAEAQRNHTAERYVMDFGIAMVPTFAGVIGPIDEAFNVSRSGTCKIKFNNVPDAWDSPDLSITLTRSDLGAFAHIDDQDTEYRYACVEIVDRENTLGPTGIKIGRIWVGDHLEVTTSNIKTGFKKQNVDDSDEVRSVSGIKYYRQKPKYRSFESLEIQNLTAAERAEFEATFELLGISESFFVSLDPGILVSASIDEMTFYANFSEVPSLEHVIRDYYSVSFSLEEAV